MVPVMPCLMLFLVAFLLGMAVGAVVTMKADEREEK